VNNDSNESTSRPIDRLREITCGIACGRFPGGIVATARSETVRNGGRDHSPPASDRTRCFARLQNEKPKTRRASEIPRDYVAKTVYIITELRARARHRKRTAEVGIVCVSAYALRKKSVAPAQACVVRLAT